MKNILKLLSVAVVFYLLFAFANLDINFANWSKEARFVFALMVVPISFLATMLIKLFDELD